MDVTYLPVGRTPARLRCGRVVGARPGRGRTVVLLHGGSHTAQCWISTPDGRDGWAGQFADDGYDVYVVDYIDIGEDYLVLDRTVEHVLDGLLELLRTIGPATVVGHSLGGGLAVKLAERAPDLLDAVVLAAPAAVESRNPAVAAVEPGASVRLPRQVARDLVANSTRFPSEAFDAWFEGLVAYSSHLRNAGAGVTDELKIDRDRADVWRRIPTLMLLAELDRTVPVAAAAATADAMGITPVRRARTGNCRTTGTCSSSSTAVTWLPGR